MKTVRSLTPSALLKRLPWRRPPSPDLIEPNPRSPTNRFGKATCGHCAFLDQTPREVLGRQASMQPDIDTRCRDLGQLPGFKACGAYQAKLKEKP